MVPGEILGRVSGPSVALVFPIESEAVIQSMKFLILIFLSMNAIFIPNDQRAEMALLGAAVQGKFDDLLEVDVDNSWFHDLECKALWKLLVQMNEAGDDIQETTVSHRAQASDSVKLTFLFKVIESLPTLDGYTHWLNICDEQRKKRIIQQKGNQLAALALDSSEDVEQLVAKAEAEIYSLCSQVISGGRDAKKEGIREMIQILEDAHLGRETGLSTGVPSLDTLLGGMNPGQLIVLGARPGIGKTALALNIADTQVAKGKSVAFFSFEMTSSELSMRLISARADEDLSGQVVQRRASEEVRQKIIQKVSPYIAKLMNDGLQIIEPNGYTVAQICSKARRLVKDQGVELIIVDYLQLITENKEDARKDRHVQVAKISKSLKALAMELKIPVFALVQLNRDADNEDIPRISQIKESGAIEQDANCVLLLSPQVGMFDGPNQLVKLAVGKNRGGRQGIIDLVFVKNKLRFEEASEPHHEEWLNRKAAEKAV